MQQCSQCGSTNDVRSLTVMPVSMDDDEIFYMDFCLACLVEKGFYCDMHGIHIAVYNDDEPDVLSSACPGCALIKLEGMKQESVSRCITLIKEDLSSETMGDLKVLGSYGADEDQKIILGLCLLSEFANQSAEEMLSDMLRMEQRSPTQ